MSDALFHGIVNNVQQLYLFMNILWTIGYFSIFSMLPWQGNRCIIFKFERLKSLKIEYKIMLQFKVCGTQ